MAKRFTETNKWNDAWFSSLSPTQKFVFLYLIDVCDNAGFYELNFRRMEFDLGLTKEKIEGALEGLTRGLQGANDILWIKNFLRHQNNLPLNSNNPAHRQIIKLVQFQIDKVSGDKSLKDFEGALKGLLSPTGIGKGTGNSKKEFTIGGVGDFYSEQVEKNIKGDKIDFYKAFIDFLFKANPSGKPIEHILKIENQVDYGDFCKLFERAQGDISKIFDMLASMMNTKKYTTGKTYLFLTLNDWFIRDGKRK